MAVAQARYEQLLNDAKEEIFVVAVRQALDARRLLVEFDPHRMPGQYDEHTLTISVRDSDLSVSADGIPHAWLAIGTGYIDKRFAVRIAALLQELDKKARAAGHLI